ncbi:cytochrome P450 3A11, partial [Exaiptasia diaphana]|uniref:Cytochrome P450 n=1 Tax=Exaiptasia diaphana TaxID=2652724 RepID=A0A913XEU4_EXADI
MDIYSSSLEFIKTHWSTCAIGAVVLIFVYWYGTRSRSRLEKTFPGIPGPKQWPFIGSLPDVIRSGGQMHLQFDNDYKKFGKVYRTMFFGSPSLVVSDPAMIKDIFVKYFDCFHDRPSLASTPEPFDKGLFDVKGEKWKRIRTIASPSFSSHKLKGMVPLMNVRCDTLVSKVEEYAKSGETFDIVKDQQALTLDIFFNFADQGIETDFQKNPNDPVIKKVLKSMNPGFWEDMFFFFVLPNLPFGKTILNTDTVAKFQNRYFYEVADLAREVIAAKRKDSTQK